MPPKKQLKDKKPQIKKKPQTKKKLTNDEKKSGGAKPSNDDSEDSVLENSSSEEDIKEENYDEVDDDDNFGDDAAGVEDEDKDESEEEDKEESADEHEENVPEGYDCLYRFSKKKTTMLDDDDDADGDAYFFGDEEITHVGEFVSNDKRITKPVLTKYERVRIIGERAKQLASNAKPMVKGVENLGPKEVARLELEMGVMPIVVIRTLPTGMRERWKASELKICN